MCDNYTADRRNAGRKRPLNSLGKITDPLGIRRRNAEAVILQDNVYRGVIAMLSRIKATVRHNHILVQFIVNLKIVCHRHKEVLTCGRNILTAVEVVVRNHVLAVGGSFDHGLHRTMIGGTSEACGLDRSVLGRHRTQCLILSGGQGIACAQFCLSLPHLSHIVLVATVCNQRSRIVPNVRFCQRMK